MKDWLDDYYNRYKSLYFKQMFTISLYNKNLCLSVKENKSKIILCGNGASSTIASHASTISQNRLKFP